MSVNPVMSAHYDQLIELLDIVVIWQKFGMFLPGIKNEHIQVIECDKKENDQKKLLFYKMFSCSS